MPADNNESSISQKRTYTLKLAGTVDEEFLNSFCPTGTMLAQGEDGATMLTIHTDQSGLIGMLRLFHNLGFIILAVRC